MFNRVDWSSHYSRSNFQPVTLKTRMLLRTCPTNLYLIYRLIYHMLSATSCRFLSKSQMTSSLKLKHVVITSHHVVLSFKHHSTVLITLEFWPTASLSTLLTTFTHNDNHNILLPLLASSKATKFPTDLFHFQFKTLN